MGRRIQTGAEATGEDTQQATRARQTDTDVIGADPEPRALYQLIRQTFVQHTMTSPPCCVACGAEWPCQTVRLAFRLREAF